VIELSCDLGEMEPEKERPIWPMIDAANVACGGHAGDATTMREAAESAARLGVIFGAHPSYPDRENFGRRSMRMDPDALRRTLIEQITTLLSFGRVRRVKPHGALYNDAHHDRALADVIVQAIRDVDPTMALVAIDSSQMAAAARAAGLTVIREAFADRGYRPDGSLVPRSEAGALLSVEESAEQALRFGKSPDVDTICIHADMEGSIERLRAIRQRLAPLLRMTSE
jgi:5-oxoprolinase (ATP-hydrolysing) subunit A